MSRICTGLSTPVEENGIASRSSSPGIRTVLSNVYGGEEDGKGPKYEPITVEDWMRGRYAATYGTTDKTESDMVQEAGKS